MTKLLRWALIGLVSTLAIPASAVANELIVTTLTGTRKNAGSDLRVFLRINDEEKRYKLDNRGVNDREAGATDVYKGIAVDLDPEDIEKVYLEVEGDDAWFLERIYFQLVVDGEPGEKVDIRGNKWLSGEKESNVRSWDTVRFNLAGKL